MTDQTAEYVARVFKLVSSSPTSAELDELLEAHARIGYLAAEAEGLAEEAENVRKYEEANAYLNAKRAEEKVTERVAEAKAALATHPHRTAEAEATTKARKLKNLLESITQVINGIKYLGRAAGGVG